MIAIIDYNMGNIRSVENALHRLGAEYMLTADPAAIVAADRVLLPGVGNCGEAMAHLVERGLVDVIRGLRQPVLGICVGMQVMCRHTEEGDAPCLGIFDSHVRRFPDRPGVKVPHMGWNTLGNIESKLLAGIHSGEYVYFVHSYYSHLCPDTVATTTYDDIMYSSVLKYENFYGTQFHPEKSGDVGQRIIANFLAL